MQQFKVLAPAFLDTSAGMAVFIVLDVAVFILIAALNYRWLFKRVFDILFSALFLILFSPFFALFLAADALYNRAVNAFSSLFEVRICCGKKGKAVRLYTLTTERVQHGADGALLPEGERATRFGRFLKGCGIKYYPFLAHVFTGRLSFVGPVPLSLADAEALPEEARARFAVRPGIVSSLVRYGGEKLTFAEMFEEDAEYALHVGLFRDIFFFVSRLVQKVRGEKYNYLGETAGHSYLSFLVSSGEMTEEEAAALAARAEERLRRKKQERSEKQLFGERYR